MDSWTKNMFLLPWKALFPLILFWLFSPFSCAEEKILAVISDDNPIHEIFYNALLAKLDNKDIIEKITISDISGKNLNSFTTVISVGTDAAIIVSRTSKINHLVSTLIPSKISDSLSTKPCHANTCQYIRIEQPLERYFVLFKNLFPVNKTLVVATSDIKKRSPLRSLAKKYNINIKILIVRKNDVSVRMLLNNLERNSVLLALPDPYIYNKNTAKNIILTAYHKNIPIIAYSQAFAKAGALISLYSSFDDIANQTIKVLKKNNLSNEKIFYPELFSIEINNSVARSLDIDIGSAEEIKRRIK